MEYDLQPYEYRDYPVTVNPDDIGDFSSGGED
jgi:hypothetical protein